MRSAKACLLLASLLIVVIVVAACTEPGPYEDHDELSDFDPFDEMGALL